MWLYKQCGYINNILIDGLISKFVSMSVSVQ